MSFLSDVVLRTIPFFQMLPSPPSPREEESEHLGGVDDVEDDVEDVEDVEGLGGEAEEKERLGMIASERLGDDEVSRKEQHITSHHIKRLFVFW